MGSGNSVTVAGMTSTVLLSLLLVVLTVAVSPLVVFFAARRSAAQWFPLVPEQEHLVVHGARQEWRDEAEELTAQMFADTTLASTWQDYLDGSFEGSAEVDHDTWIDAGEQVMAAHGERDLYRGRGMVGVDDSGTQIRVPTPVTATRLWVSGVLTAAVMAVAVWSGWSLGTQAAVAVLALAGLVVALVDWDTLYIDFPVAGVMTLAAVVAVWLSPLSSGWMVILPSVCVVLLLSVVIVVFRLLRGVWGMAWGDVAIMPAVIIAPAGWTGNPEVGVMAFMCASVLALVGYFLTHRGHRGVPFAFGPFLIYGWVPAAAMAMLAA